MYLYSRWQLTLFYIRSSSFLFIWSSAHKLGPLFFFLLGPQDSVLCTSSPIFGPPFFYFSVLWIRSYVPVRDNIVNFVSKIRVNNFIDSYGKGYIHRYQIAQAGPRAGLLSYNCRALQFLGQNKM